MNPSKHVIDDQINQIHDQDNDELNDKEIIIEGWL